MSLPVGVETCTVTFGSAVSFVGAPAKIEATLMADRTIVHAATGMSVWSGDDQVTAVSGSFLTFAVPVVDQAGFVDASGAAVTSWFYTLTGRITFENGKTANFSRNFQVFHGQTNVDLDLVPDGPVLPGASAPSATVYSVAGHSGLVTVEQLAAALDVRYATKDTVTGNLRATVSGPTGIDAEQSVLLGNLAGNELTSLNRRNVAVGARALAIAGRSGDTSHDNIAIGPFQAMGTTLGVGNIALGFSTLGGAESGNGPAGFVPPAVQNYNVALGYEALIYGTDASENVVLGRNAMTEIWSGLGNVALGSRALRACKITSRFNIAIGYSALDNGTVVGTNTRGHNIAIGRSAMQDATGADVTDNVVLGSDAGNALQARNNVFIGKSSGGQQTTAIENVGIGTLALAANVTGAALVAIGSDALRFNTAANNTAIGYAALRANTTASNNTAVGKQSLTNNTTGASNTSVGSGAMQTSSTGGFNTAVGAGALAAATTAVNNSAVGANALTAVTTGGLNTAVGGAALQALTTGASNTALGQDASTTLVSLTNAVIIGKGARVNANEGTALGQGATVGHIGSVALGQGTTTTDVAQVMVGPRDVEITDTTKGVVIKSPDGTRYRIKVANGGALSAVAA